MNVLILAAGYATRLYPLTKNKAKPLLEVAGKPMIEWVLDNLAPIPDLGTIYVVTNDKFAHDFQAWADGYAKARPKFTFKIVNDGSRSDADKLGAIGDIRLVIDREELTQRAPHRRGGRQLVQRTRWPTSRRRPRARPQPLPPTMWAISRR